MYKILNTCMKSWIHVWNPEYKYEILNTCMKSWIHIRNPEYMYEILNICMKSWIHVWNPEYKYEILNTCMKSWIHIRFGYLSTKFSVRRNTKKSYKKKSDREIELFPFHTKSNTLNATKQIQCNISTQLFFGRSL